MKNMEHLESVDNTFANNVEQELNIPSLNKEKFIQIKGEKQSVFLTLACKKGDARIDQPNQKTLLKFHVPSIGSFENASHCFRSGAHNIHFYDTDSQIKITPNDSTFSFLITTGKTSPIETIFDMDFASWFGYGYLLHHHWPLNNAAMILSPAFPFDNCPTGVSTLLDPSFITSTGVSLSIDDDCPCLHIGINCPVHPRSKIDSPYTWTVGLGALNNRILPDKTSLNENKTLIIQSRRSFDHTHLKHSWSGHVHKKKTPHLSFSISTANNIKNATKNLLSERRQKYGQAKYSKSKVRMMRFPIWSTWVKFKREINQEKIIKFAEEIIYRGFPASVMGIDDKWSSKYGEIRFDPVKFPDPLKMVRKLHELGFMVTLWVTPFASLDAFQLSDETIRDYYVKMPSGELGKFNWWQPGEAVALDVTNPMACEWFISQLRKMQENFDVDGFKFDAGEPCFLQSGSKLQDNLECPSEYTRSWINNIASKSEVAECRSAVRGCQSATPMFRIFDKYSTWGLENGLASVVTEILTCGILGFPFCLPDYVAGNAYGDENPECELLIRWTQLSVAMAAIQFSIPPWFFEDPRCVPAVQKALKWREKVFWPKISTIIPEASEKLWPIVRPMWWEEQDTEEIENIYDQFMVGQDLLVAPILRKGQAERSVFIPKGLWRKVDTSSCKMYGEIISGPLLVENVLVPLDEMPFYHRISDK